MNCTIKQAVGIWDELLSSYYDNNGYGGQTAEIYSYRLEEYSPGVHKARDIVPDMFKSDEKRIAVDAAMALLGIIKLFLETHECKITIEGLTVAQWKKEISKGTGLFHRYHVKVIKKG